MIESDRNAVKGSVSPGFSRIRVSRFVPLGKITQTPTEQKIEAVICGGRVPFLKELAEHSQTAHSMNLDIDPLACEGARARGH